MWTKLSQQTDALGDKLCTKHLHTISLGSKQMIPAGIRGMISQVIAPSAGGNMRSLHLSQGIISQGSR